MAGPGKSRLTPRKQVNLPAMCRTHSGLRDDCQIADISAHGCCLLTNRLLVRIGARVTVRPQGLEGLTGVVRWIRGNRVGVEFDTPLYEPVVDHLTRLHSITATVNVAFQQ